MLPAAAAAICTCAGATPAYMTVLAEVGSRQCGGDRGRAGGEGRGEGGERWAGRCHGPRGIARPPPPTTWRIAPSDVRYRDAASLGPGTRPSAVGRIAETRTCVGRRGAAGCACTSARGSSSSGGGSIGGDRGPADESHGLSSTRECRDQIGVEVFYRLVRAFRCPHKAAVSRAVSSVTVTHRLLILRSCHVLTSGVNHQKSAQPS